MPFSRLSLVREGKTVIDLPITHELSLNRRVVSMLDDRNSNSGAFKYEIGRSLKPDALAKRRQQMEAVASHFFEDCALVSVGLDNLRVGDTAVGGFPLKLAQEVHGKLNVAVYPERLNSSRKLRSHVVSLLEGNPSILLLGVSWQEFGEPDDASEGKPKEISLDEFRANLEFVMYQAALSNCKVLWIEPCCSSKDSAVDEPKDFEIAQYISAVRDLAIKYDHRTVSLSQRMEANSKSSARATKKALLREISFELLELQSSLQPTNIADKGVGPVEDLQDIFPNSGKVRRVDQGPDPLILNAAQASSLFLAIPNSGEVSGVDEGSGVNSSDKSLGRLGGRNEFERFTQMRIVQDVARVRRPALPSGLLIGDSIRMRIADGTGWGRHAYKLLQGDINLYHVPHNCGGTKVHKQMLKNWLSPRPNLVFINAGLHDLAFSWDTMKGAALWVSLDEYAANLQWEVELMRSEKVATILWGLCTPVQEDWHRFVPGTSKKRRIGRRNSDIEAYNSVAEAVMCQLEVPVVDLYTPVVDGGVENLVLPDGVHLNTLGAALVGELVATSTTEYLEGLA